jgi:hypothetical protein
MNKPPIQFDNPALKVFYYWGVVEALEQLVEQKINYQEEDFNILLGNMRKELEQAKLNFEKGLVSRKARRGKRK